MLNKSQYKSTRTDLHYLIDICLSNSSREGRPILKTLKIRKKKR